MREHGSIERAGGMEAGKEGGGVCWSSTASGGLSLEDRQYCGRLPQGSATEANLSREESSSSGSCPVQCLAI
jgi:hypothetical protein